MNYDYIYRVYMAGDRLSDYSPQIYQSYIMNMAGRWESEEFRITLEGPKLDPMLGGYICLAIL